MLQSIYSFFENIFCTFVADYNGDFPFDDLLFQLGVGNTISLSRYLTLLCSIVSMIIIVVLCCLFVYKIIKLIGGLIR